jgi:hypothetical protein
MHTGRVVRIAVILTSTARVNLDGAVGTVPASNAVTPVVIDKVDARSAVLTRVGAALIEVD